MTKLIAIKLRSGTLELLTSVGHENESVESIINRLLKEWNNNN